MPHFSLCITWLHQITCIRVLFVHQHYSFSIYTIIFTLQRETITFTLIPFQLFEGTGNRHWCLFAALLDKLRLTVPLVACKSSATILVGIYPQLGFLRHIQYCASLHQQSLDQHYTFSNSTIFMYIATIQHATILQIYPYLGPQLCVQYYSFFHYIITLRCCHSACYLVRIDMHWSIQHRISSTHSALHDCITRLLFHVLP